MEFIEAKSFIDFEEARSLFNEYTGSLKDLLGPQDFEGELKGIAEKYTLPHGYLILAKQNGVTIGCIGLKKMTSTDCEMKRLYVKPEYRANGAGKELSKLLIEKARQLGFKTMFLDTLPQLKSAIKLYKNLGFLECEAYYESPLTEPIYMKLEL